MLLPTMVLAELPIGEIPPKVVLKGDLGGRLDGTQWSSEELVSGKVIVLFYVDPDESELNNHVSDALKAENYPKEKYGSIGMANMAATWLPNIANARACFGNPVHAMQNTLMNLASISEQLFRASPGLKGLRIEFHCLTRNRQFAPQDRLYEMTSLTAGRDMG